MKRLHSYLHVHRRAQCLNQAELAFLLGKRSASSISRLELRKRDPGLEAVLACEVLFNIAPSELFPVLFSEVEAAVVRRTYVLTQRLKRSPTPATAAKLALLNNVLVRASRRNKRTNS